MFLYSCPSVSPFQTLKVRQTPPPLCYNPPLIPAALGLHETMPGNDSSAAKRARIPQRGPQAPRFIVIEGPLRVGKTTLARVLAERLHARRIYDCEDNPFLADFYKAKPGSAVRAQMYFLIERQKRLREALAVEAPGPMLSDFLMEKDRIFANLNLDDSELRPAVAQTFRPEALFLCPRRTSQDMRVTFGTNLRRGI